MCDNANNEFSVQIGSLPDSFTETVFQQIKKYATGLGIDDPESKTLTFIGSGTFIKWGNHYGILTAEHVVNHPFSNALTINTSASSKQKVCILLDEHQNNFGFEAYALVIHSLGKRDSNEYGPDLAVIELPPCSALTTLIAQRDFWNVTFEVETKLNRALCESGCMAIAGHPAEDIGAVMPAAGFSEATSVPGMIGFTGQEMYCRRGNHDYIEIRSIKDDVNLAPTSYAGVSGGSLWRVPILKNAAIPDSLYMPGEITLAGVPFFQIPNTNDGDNRVRAHGPQSIYRELIRHLPS